MSVDFRPIRRRVIEENVTGFADKFLIKIFSNHACIGKKDILVFLNTTEDVSHFPEVMDRQTRQDLSVTN